MTEQNLALIGLFVLIWLACFASSMAVLGVMYAFRWAFG